MVLGLLLLALVLAPAAAAQHPHGLPGGPRVRPLTQRLELADAAAVGRIRQVTAGRIEVEEAAAVFGAPGSSFSLKRAPSSPPPLEPGARAVLLLRGARSPYVLVDTPAELPILADAAAEARWRAALAELRAARGQPDRLRRLHLDWLAGPEAGLRAAAESGLVSPSAPFAPLPADVAAGLAGDALDPTLPRERRRAAARVALTSEPGRRALLPRLPGDSAAADAEMLLDALQAGARLGDPALDALLARALEHPRDDVRRAALSQSRRAARGELARAALERVAESDPVEDHRARARRALSRR